MRGAMHSGFVQIETATHMIHRVFFMLLDQEQDPLVGFSRPLQQAGPGASSSDAEHP